MLTEGSVTIRLGPQVGLSFINCSGIEIKSLIFLLSGDFKHRLMFSDANNVQLHNIMMNMEDLLHYENGTGCSNIVSQASVINISDSSFIGIRGQYGAALLVLDSSEITFVGTNNFTSNSARLGGAIHSISSTLQFTDTASFTNNTATLNRNDTVSQCFSYLTSNDTGMGGAIFAEDSHVIISDCAQFLGNSATYGGGAIAIVNSSALFIDGSSCLNKSHPMTLLFDGNSVTITRASEFSSNFDRLGSGGALFTYDCVVNITNVSMNNNFSPGFGGAAQFTESNTTLCNINAVNNTGNISGGAIRINSSEEAHIHGDNYFINNYAMDFGGAIEIFEVQFLKIDGTNTFEANGAENGGGGALSCCIIGTMSFICGDNVFKRNFASNGGAVYVYGATVHFCGSSMFIEDVASFQGGAMNIVVSTIIFNATNMISFNRNNATLNGGAVASFAAQMQLYGNIQFHNNVASNGTGGAMCLYYNTTMILNPQTIVDFSENYALYGGAIYLEDSLDSSLNCFVARDTKPECFIVLNITYSLLNNASILLNFTNNMANRYGSVLFGGQLGRCKLLFTSNTSKDTCGDRIETRDDSKEIVMSISTIVNASEQESNTIVSPPFKLCLCDHLPYECTSDSANIRRYLKVAPGQTFGISMVAQDLYNSIIQGVPILSMSNAEQDDSLRPENYTVTSSSCQNFTYRLLVESIDSDPSFTFVTSDLCRVPSGRDQIDLYITIKPCPVGFNFSKKERICVCSDMLKNFAEECDIEDQSVKRSRNNFWINITADYFLIYERTCPLDYCQNNTKVVDIKFNEPDVQCLEGRTGKICGSCKSESYSLVLGSLHCQQNCSHVSLLLIIPFGVLGILLIALIFLLRLTVSAGTINGMIFYANIIQANHQILLPKVTSDPNYSKLFNFLIVFISWLNLDFGIHACFFKGMDIYTYSWLQFLFPLYLWILVIIIIISAHYSLRVSKRLGQNPGAVLATVLLISYGKMLKAIIVPLSPATIKNVTQSESNVSNEIVWLYNGDIKYCEPKHIILVLFAILVLVFLFLPYTLLLLCGHYLQIKSQWRIFSWINKLKPFMDAYHAPYKKRKYYLIGIFLLARCALFLSVAFAPDPAINLTVVSSVVAGLSIFRGRVYEKWYNNFLESSFLLNLCILSIASLYVRSVESSHPDEAMGHQNIISSISVGIAFIYFIGVVAFHTYQQIRKLKLSKTFRSYNLKKKFNENSYNEQSLEIISNSSVNLRELLLDDDS